jgi:hypothetical protein
MMSAINRNELTFLLVRREQICTPAKENLASDKKREKLHSLLHSLRRIRSETRVEIRRARDGQSNYETLTQVVLLLQIMVLCGELSSLYLDLTRGSALRGIEGVRIKDHIDRIAYIYKQLEKLAQSGDVEGMAAASLKVVGREIREVLSEKEKRMDEFGFGRSWTIISRIYSIYEVAGSIIETIIDISERRSYSGGLEAVAARLESKIEELEKGLSVCHI